MPTEQKPEQKKAPKEVIIVIDDPVTGRAHLEFPGAEAQPKPEEAPEAKKPEAGKPQQPTNVQPLQTKTKPGAPKTPGLEEEPAKAASLKSPLLASKQATAKTASANDGKQFPGLLLRNGENGHLVFVDDSDEGDYTQGGEIINDYGDHMDKAGEALAASSIHGVTFDDDLAELVKNYGGVEDDPEYVAKVQKVLDETGHAMLSDECSIIKVKPEDWASMETYTAQDELPALDFGTQVQ